MGKELLSYLLFTSGIGHEDSKTSAVRITSIDKPL